MGKREREGAGRQGEEGEGGEWGREREGAGRQGEEGEGGEWGRERGGRQTRRGGRGR